MTLVGFYGYPVAFLNFAPPPGPTGQGGILFTFVPMNR